MSSYSPFRAFFRFSHAPVRGKEGLADVEAQAVIIRIEKPRGHVVAFATMADFHFDRIEDIESEQFDFVTV